MGHLNLPNKKRYFSENRNDETRIIVTRVGPCTLSLGGMKTVPILEINLNTIPYENFIIFFSNPHIWFGRTTLWSYWSH